MAERILPYEVQVESELQYRGENASSLNADARRQLYKYAEDGVDVWQEMAADLMKGRGTVLDVGTGSCVMISKLLEAGYEGPLVGTDIAQNQFEFAGQAIKEEFPESEVKLMVDDANHMLLPDESVDQAVAAFLTYHMPEPDRAIRECWRVLKPGGRLIVSSRDVENQERIWRMAGLAADKVDATRPRSFYSHCDLAATRALTSEIFGNEPEKEFIQDCALNMPPEAWPEVSLAISSLRTTMRVHEDPSMFPPIIQFNRLVDTDIFKVFQQDIYGLPGVSAKGAFKDRVRQGYYVYRKAA